MPPRRRCPVCGSKKWHKEPSSGLIACSEGHVLQNYRNETNEQDEYGPHALRKRALKSTRKKREHTSQADPNLYHGNRARFLYFQCLQLLLRKQIAALITLWELPPEFESVCRDVWALHLSLLPSPPPAEPYLHAQEQGEGGTHELEVPGVPAAQTLTPVSEPEGANAQFPKRGRQSKLKGEPKRPHTRSHSRSSASSRGSASSSSPSQGGTARGEGTEDEGTGEEGTGGEDRDDELEDLMRQLSGSEDSSDDGAPSAEDRKFGPAPRRRKKGHAPHEAPMGNLSVLVVACWTMRVPVLYKDLIRLVENYDVPYMDPVRRGVLPQEMIGHLTKQGIQALSPPFAPTTMMVHALSSRLSRLLYTHYGILTPEANAAPILWQSIRCLGGTPVLYVHTKSLARMLSLPLTLHRVLAPPLVRLRADDPESHQLDDVPPEVALLAAALIVLKMVYGLDGRPRMPADDADPACGLPRLEAYLATVRALDGCARNTTDELFSPRNQLFTEQMSDGTLDEFLDFSEKALLGDAPDRERSTFAEHFPRPRAGANKGNQAGNGDGWRPRMPMNPPPAPLAANLPAEGLGAEQQPLLPGQGYRIYDAQDVLGELPEAYEALVARAAWWAGVEVGEMGRVVERYEHRLVRWWKGEKRGSRTDGSGMSGERSSAAGRRRRSRS